MRKLLIAGLAALVAMVSSIAAVSAFEAHVINVKAHVENALTVDTLEFDMGTVFPEEWRITHRNIALSESALGELGTGPGQLASVTFKIYAECKQNPAGGYYKWIGEALWLDWNGASYTNVGPVGDGDGDCIEGGQIPEVIDTGFGQTLDANTQSGQLSIGFDTPVFEGYYNAWTDVCNKPRPDTFGPVVAGKLQDPSGGTMPDVNGNGIADDPCQAPTWIIGANDDRHNPEGVDLGVDLKVQVTAITRN